MKHSNILGAAAALSAALILGACGNQQETAVTTVATETTIAPETTVPTTTQETTQTAPETTTDVSEEKESTEGSSLVNPMKQAESSEDFKALDLSLYLPEDPSWCSGAVYYIIDQNVAHIKFYDNSTKSDAVARAAKEELGDVSGVYYNFDDTKEMKQEIEVKAGEKVQIKVQLVVDGSDIPGVLASWNYNGTNFTLWEDKGKNSPESVAKLAEEIAKLNAE